MNSTSTIERQQATALTVEVQKIMSTWCEGIDLKILGTIELDYDALTGISTINPESIGGLLEIAKEFFDKVNHAIKAEIEEKNLKLVSLNQKLDEIGTIDPQVRDALAQQIGLQKKVVTKHTVGTPDYKKEQGKLDALEDALLQLKAKRDERVRIQNQILMLEHRDIPGLRERYMTEEEISNDLRHILEALEELEITPEEENENTPDARKKGLMVKITAGLIASSLLSLCAVHREKKGVEEEKPKKPDMGEFRRSENTMTQGEFLAQFSLIQAEVHHLLRSGVKTADLMKKIPQSIKDAIANGLYDLETLEILDERTMVLLELHIVFSNGTQKMVAQIPVEQIFKWKTEWLIRVLNDAHARSMIDSILVTTSYAPQGRISENNRRLMISAYLVSLFPEYDAIDFHKSGLEENKMLNKVMLTFYFKPIVENGITRPPEFVSLAVDLESLED